jgi:hypothetical protein
MIVEAVIRDRIQPYAAHFHILRVFHQVKQWIGEADNMEAKDWG